MKSLLLTFLLLPLVTWAQDSQTLVDEYLHPPKHLVSIDWGYPNMTGVEYQYAFNPRYSAYAEVGLINYAAGMRYHLTQRVYNNDQKVKPWGMYIGAQAGMTGLVDVGGGLYSNAHLGVQYERKSLVVSAEYGLIRGHQWSIAGEEGTQDLFLPMFQFKVGYRFNKLLP